MKATTYPDFSQRIWTVHDTLHVWVGDATLEITEALAALPADTAEFTVTVLAFNKNGDAEGVLRLKELTLLTYARPAPWTGPGCRALV